MCAILILFCFYYNTAFYKRYMGRIVDIWGEPNSLTASRKNLLFRTGQKARCYYSDKWVYYP